MILFIFCCCRFFPYGIIHVSERVLFIFFLGGRYVAKKYTAGMGASDNKYDIWDIEQWEPAQLLRATGVVLQLTGIFTGATVWAEKSFNTRFSKTSRRLKAKMTKAAQRAKQGTKAAGQAVKATAKYTYQKLGRVTVNFVENVNETAKNLRKTIFDALKAIEKDLELTLDLITGTNPQYSLAIVGNAVNNNNYGMISSSLNGFGLYVEKIMDKAKRTIGLKVRKGKDAGRGANKAKNVSKPTNVTEEREAIKELFPRGLVGRIPYEEGSI